jgi:hypothetical protein
MGRDRSLVASHTDFKSALSCDPNVQWRGPFVNPLLPHLERKTRIAGASEKNVGQPIAAAAFWRSHAFRAACVGQAAEVHGRTGQPRRL